MKIRFAGRRFMMSLTYWTHSSHLVYTIILSVAKSSIPLYDSYMAWVASEEIPVVKIWFIIAPICRKITKTFPQFFLKSNFSMLSLKPNFLSFVKVYYRPIVGKGIARENLSSGGDPRIWEKGWDFAEN